MKTAALAYAVTCALPQPPRTGENSPRRIPTDCSGANMLVSPARMRSRCESGSLSNRLPDDLRLPDEILLDLLMGGLELESALAIRLL